MITFDAEYSTIVHFEIDEETALEHGGIDIETAKRNCICLSDWILAGIADTIEIGESDSVTVIPVEQKLVINGKEIILDGTPEDYKTQLDDGSIVDFKTEEIERKDENNENTI